jgi:Microbial-type PARG, catalytic domain
VEPEEADGGPPQLNEHNSNNAPTEKHEFVASAALRRRVEAQAPRLDAKSAATTTKAAVSSPQAVFANNGEITRALGFTIFACDGHDEQFVRLPELIAERFSLNDNQAAAAQVAENPAARSFLKTQYCCANIDTVSAALALGNDTAVLSFANGEIPGGRYISGGRAQEEDLCRLLPQLYPSLLQSTENPIFGPAAPLGDSDSERNPSRGSQRSPHYPLPPGTVLITRNCRAVRRVSTYARCASQGEMTVLTACMPCGTADRRPKGGWLGSPWAEDVRLRLRSVLAAAAHTGHENLVLGAFGCGAFGNPATPVAVLFREALASPEFRGRFARVVFAVIDPVGTGNLAPFRRELSSLRSL